MKNEKNSDSCSNVSIPYRLATNNGESKTPSRFIQVSIPYRLATNSDTHLNSKYERLVSIPYRLATNVIYFLTVVMILACFNPL